jgi:hypothetical protein
VQNSIPNYYKLMKKNQESGKIKKDSSHAIQREDDWVEFHCCRRREKGNLIEPQNQNRRGVVPQAKSFLLFRQF